MWMSMAGRMQSKSVAMNTSPMNGACRTARFKYNGFCSMGVLELCFQPTILSFVRLQEGVHWDARWGTLADWQNDAGLSPLEVISTKRML